MEEKRERIVWIDVYKALCIILVVVGHATGLFNHYIYQFHMAAFFFISGYTAKIWKKDLENSVLEKSRTLLLPWFTMVVSFGIVRAVISVVRANVSFRDGISAIESCARNALTSASADSLLGAGWFLLVLFFVFLIQRLIWRATEKHHIAIYGVATATVYLLGYYLQKNGYREPHGFDIALLAQIFFGMGVLLNKCNVLEVLRRKKWCYAVYAGAVLWMFLARRFGDALGGYLVDYPSHAYPNVFMMAIVPAGGILFIFGLSELISRLGDKVTWVFRKLGASTLGVLFFHFLGFKIATILLIPFKVTVWEDTTAFLLPPSAQAHGWCWLFYSVISLLFCVLAWELLMRIPYVNVLLGKKIPKKQTQSPTP